MTADVYAGDDALRDGGVPVEPAGGFEFHIRADPDPDVLSRIANQLLFANTAPWHLDLAHGADGVLTVRVEMRGIAAAVAESIRRKLMQLTCIVDIEVQSRACDVDPGPQ